MTEPATQSGSWPAWDRDQPEELARYVAPEEVQAHCVGLPGRDDSGQLGRLRRVYDAFAAMGSRYAHEPLSADPRGQRIRPPDQVLRAPGEATCLDAAVVFAGACLHAGLHPLVLVLDPRAAGEPAHALVAVWIEGSWDGRPAPDYPRDAPLVIPGDGGFAGRVRRELDLPGAFAVLDPSAGLVRSDHHPAPFEEAVARGVEALLRGDERLRFGVDVGFLYGGRPAHRPPGWPWWADGTSPLARPYQDREGLDLRSVKLLRAEYRAVPFQARDELDVLRDWCLDPSAPTAPRVAIVTGVGGAGKTRLAAELAHQLAQEGWYTGFARSIEGGDAPLANWLATTVGPLLVVVDYAEARTALVTKLLQALRNRTWAATGLVLTARAPGEWTAEVEKELVRGRHPSTPLAVHLQPSHPEPARLYRRALSGLTEIMGGDPSAGRSLRSSERRSDWTTLDLVMLAWLAALGHDGAPESRAELYEEILGHERRYWRDTHESHGLDGWSERLFDEAATCLALLEPSVHRAPEVLRAVLELEDDEQARWRGQVADSLARCMSAMDGRLSIKPDSIADHLVLHVLGPDAEETPDGKPPLVVRCVELANQRERSSGLVNLTRAASQGRETAVRLAGLLVRSVPGLWRPALALAEAVGGAFVDGLAEYAEAEATELPLAELAEQLPLGHAHLRPLAVAAATRLMRDHVAGDDAAEAARLLSNLAVRLSEAGRREEALEASLRVASRYRQLAAANPAAFLPQLAGSLTNLANSLTEVGHHHEALDVAFEAVSHHRQLAGVDPAAFLPDLAMSLTNLAAILAGLGRQEALEVISEAVSIRRQLVAANTAASLPDLAMSLINLAAILSGLGRRQEALEAATEAVSHYRPLAAANPAAFLPNLAASLTSMASMLSEVGRRQEALKTSIEAVSIRRQLAAANPAAFLPDLAMVLSNLAAILSGLGRRQEALEAISEAVTHYRHLAESNPRAFLSNLATSLNNQASMLSQVGNRQDALTAISEAVSHHRQLADADPAAFLSNLAATLSNQAAMLSEVGRRQEALEASSEAVSHYRPLASANRAFLPNLAASLSNRANMLSEVGRRQEALEAGTEAVSHYRPLAAANPAAFLPNLANSLNRQAETLSEVGRRQEALDAGAEAVKIRRQLADANPAILHDLAMSLNNLAIGLSDMGRRQEALEASAEAVAHYRQLDAANPEFLHGMAAALDNQANGLSAVGRRHEALEASTQAVAYLRQLAATNPAAILPALAAALNNQANKFSDVSRRQDALEAITEAVSHYRQLAAANSTAILPDLAMALNNLAIRLSDMGRHQEALEAISEAVSIRRQLAAADPAAFLHGLAMSLGNLARSLSEVDRRQEALDAIAEAVSIRRQLAAANPAAFLPDLAGSLHHQAVRLSEVDRRQEALDAITEAVSIRRQLAAADPAAFLHDLAASLHRQATALSEVGRRQQGHETWERSITALRHHPGHQAELSASRAAWTAGQGDTAGLLTDLLEVAACAPDQPSELEALGRARRVVRSLTGHLPPSVRETLPAWSWATIPAEVTTLAADWGRVAGTPDEAEYLAQHRARLDNPETRGAMALLAELNPGEPFPAHALAVLAHAETTGADAAVGFVRDGDRLMRTLREWIAAPTWSESRALLESSGDLLLSHAVDAILGPSADADPAAAQHLGIVRLCRERPTASVYDAVTDPAEAVDQAGEATEAGDASWLRGLLLACPALRKQPFAGPAASGVLALLDGQRDAARQLLNAAAEEASDTQRRALAGRLKRLAACRPEHAAAVAELTALLRA